MGRLQDLINSRLSEKQDSIKYFYGVLGNGSVVDVPGMPGYVYVTLNDGVITQAFNTLLPSILNFPVVVGYDKSQAGNDGILTVLSARNIPRVGSSAENSYAVRRHHASHEWMNENGGQDIVYVHTRQLMPLRPTPMGNWQLYIQPDVQYVNEQWQQVGGQLFNMYSRSINSYTSGSAGDERYTLVSLSLTSGSIVFTNGSIVAKGTSTLADIPDIPANNIPICAIRFWTGQTDIIEALTQTDLIDLRKKRELQDVVSELSVPKWPAISNITHTSGSVVITDDSNHNSFPGSCSLNDGTILTAYRTATTHWGSKGVINIKSSSDGGYTWSAETEVYSHASLDARDPNITRLRNNNLVMSIKLYDLSTSLSAYSIVIISTDNGATWGSPIYTNEDFDYSKGCSAPVVEVADNVLYLPTFGSDSAGGYDYARMVKSLDGGATWADIGIIASSASRHYQEPNLCLLENGEFACFLRSNTTDHFYLTRSSDGGDTWTTPTDLFSAGGRPSIIRGLNKGVLLFYRQKSTPTDYAVYRVSLDNGYNWSNETLLDSTGTMTYGAGTEYVPGTIGLSYSVETSGSNSSNSDVFFTRFSAPVVGSTSGSGGATALSDLSDVYISGSQSPGEALIWDGSKWMPGVVSGSGGGSGGHTIQDEGVDLTSRTKINFKGAGVTAADNSGDAATDVTIPGASVDPWISDTNTWSYSSADSPTFVISVDADMTGLIGVGYRIRLTQTTEKYFIVTAVGSYSGGATLITVYGGTDYTLDNAAISNPYYSYAKTPLGFPLNPAKWTVEVTDTSLRQQSSPTKGTWYNLGGLSINIPVGCWNVTYMISSQVNSAASHNASITLSTATNSETNVDLTASFSGNVVGGGAIYKKSTVLLSAKTTYYINMKIFADGVTNMFYRNDNQKMIIWAICVYL